MKQPSPETVEQFYRLLGSRFTPAQALHRIHLTRGQAERYRLNEWLRRRVLETREEDPI